DVAVQVDLHLVIADDAQRPLRQPHLAALDLDAERRQRLGDIRRADRAEQLALGPRLSLDAHRLALELSRALLRPRELLGRASLELGPPFLELRDVLGRGDGRLAFRDEEVARVAGLHLDQVADTAQVVDFLEQNDLHQVVSIQVRGRSGARRSNQLSIKPTALSPSTTTPVSGVMSST